MLDVVGRGGEATVVKAVDTRHDRLVALKVRPVPDGADAAAAQLAEARALLSLPGHEGLAHARDDFFDEGRHVLVLDWVDGLDLATVLASQGQPGLPVSSVLRWMAQTADGLTELHVHGVVHGDIKPANLVLDQRGRVVLVDLGSSSIPSRSEVGGGTPGYRPPEVAAGEIPTRASDVYGLAATAFALLTGQPPAGVLPPSWSDAAPDQARVLEAALRAGLAVDPTRRPATPGEFVERLRAGSDERTPSGVVTVLLTDVVGSAELWEHAPAQMPAVLAELQLTVDLAVEAHGGSRLGATVEGDSTISAFPVAADAVAAAVTLQQRLGAPGLSGTQLPPLRVGIATGEVHSVGADVVGPAVNRAARIRELAGPGEVFLSATTAAVVAAASPAGVALVLMGSHALRGIAGRDEVHAVVAPGVATPPDPSRCPYPGLAPFEPDDAAFFVGREALVEECLEHLARTGFVGVIGGSGTGKSSLVRAGVVPRLERAVVFTPGEHPMDALRAATAPDAVLVVDQLEEVVTLCRDHDEQAAFLDAVRSGSTAGAVVTVRADLYGELAGFGEFSRMLAANHVLVGPMGPDELARTVTEPAAHAGLQVETGLPDLVVNELHNQPGSLPLLAHALRETWLRRDGRRLTITGYRDAGGVREAIARTADRILADLTDGERAVMRDLLLRMVELRDDGDDARRWVDLDEVQELGGDGPAMLDRLAAARLVTVESDRATLAHEALLTAWPTLRDWLRDERATLLLRQQLRRATDAWVHGGRSEADLYRGSRLDAALEWQAATQAPLTAAETAFLDVSAAQTAARTRQRARQNRRLRVLLAIAAVGFVVAATAGVVALGARDRAERSAANAVAAETAAEARRLSTLALTVEDYDQALLLAVEARHLHDSIETRSNLLAVLNRMPQAIDLVSSPAGDPWLGMALTGDGSLLAVARQDGITLYDGDTLAPTGSMEPLYIWAAAPMPGGRELAVLDIGNGPEDRPLVRFVDGDGAMTREPLALPAGPHLLGCDDDRGERRRPLPGRHRGPGPGPRRPCAEGGVGPFGAGRAAGHDRARRPGAGRGLHGREPCRDRVRPR